MLIQLYRNKPSGKAIFGRLLVDCENVSGFQSFKLQMDTLENTDYAIPAGFYRVRLTQSPRFKEILPLLDGVMGFRKSNAQNTERALASAYTQAIPLNTQKGVSLSVPPIYPISGCYLLAKH